MAGLNLERLDFDTANPGDGPNIGSFLRAGTDGDLLSSSLVSGKESLDVNIAGTDVTFTVDLDLNDPLVADDSVDTENPLKIGYRSYDQSTALTTLSAAGDKSNAISDLFRRLVVSSAPAIGGNNEAITVDTTAGGVALPATALVGRQQMFVQNSGSKSIFIGFGTVTDLNGLEVGKGSTLALEIGEALALKAIAASGGSEDTRIMELA